MEKPNPTKIYISGPMSGLPDNNFPAFNAAAAELIAAGFEVENPADKGDIPGWAWNDYMRYDIMVMMLHCRAIAYLPGWEKSKGANMEFDIARRLGWEIHPVEYWVMKASVQLAYQ